MEIRTYRQAIVGGLKWLLSQQEPDGSFKDYFIRVPPAMERARQAVAWTFRMQEMEYNPCVQT